jgi:hypothetical protein
MSTCREDMRRAWERIYSFPTQRLETRFGTIEYAQGGQGPSSSGCPMGCSDVTWIASTRGGETSCPGIPIIAPSWFGYLGSTLPAGRRPDQAEA